MSENKNEREIINLAEIVRKLKKDKKAFIKPMLVVFILSCVYIFSLPRFYTTDAKLAPEMDNSMAGSTLGSIASSFGFDLNNMQTTDAITPLLYPDLMEDNGFVAMLLPVMIQAQDGTLTVSYGDYLKKHQKRAWWSGIISWMTKPLRKSEQGESKGAFNPYRLSKDDDDIISLIRQNITLDVDKKTGVITINVKDQDPLVCKTMADSITVKLQKFITEYRTNKARVDLDYYETLADSARRDYEDANRAYSRFADANKNVILESHRTKLSELENDIQLKFTTYSTVSAQLQAAKAKVQERTPAFIILKGAAEPIKPAGPKRMIFVAGMLMLTFMVVALLTVRKKDNKKED